MTSLVAALGLVGIIGGDGGRVALLERTHKRAPVNRVRANETGRIVHDKDGTENTHRCKRDRAGTKESNTERERETKREREKGCTLPLTLTLSFTSACGTSTLLLCKCGSSSR
uniref:Putative secreted protein n=1 Tax=Anopheles darlingi TaxID=43151 RepID=A0A2M4DA63_ANODA